MTYDYLWGGGECRCLPRKSKAPPGAEASPSGNVEGGKISRRTSFRGKEQRVESIELEEWWFE